MKKAFLILILTATILGLQAQRPQSPLFFRNHLEYMNYLMEHPERIPMKTMEPYRGSYVQKLDSVVGSDNFDWTRWKNVYAYTEVDGQPSDLVRTETHYVWENQAWVPSVLTEIKKNADTDLLEHDDSYQWNGTDWDPVFKTAYYYNASLLLDSVVRCRLNDSVWEGFDRTAYEYDSLGRVSLCLMSNGKNAQGEWNDYSKYQNSYTDDGKLSFTLVYNKRNGVWREYFKDTLTYDDQGQCVVLLSKMKGMGPGGQNWRDAERYEFAYQDGQLMSETYYGGGWGWFNSVLSLNSITEYQHDTQGNMCKKTASIFNEEDWIVRDVYENSFDITVDANAILGMRQVWESILSDGMGYFLEQEMPLMNQWNSCNIVSTTLDTEFHLYYSGFAAVDETETAAFDVVGGKGRLMVNSPEPCNITIYDLLGRAVATRKQIQSAEIILSPGFYVVGDGVHSVKTIVR